MDRLMVEAVLGREVRPLELELPLGWLARKRVLVTGADGSLGRAVCAALREADVSVLGTDVGDLDVRSMSAVGRVASWGFDVVLHLAADKHAPAGELHPGEVAMTNVVGTANLVSAFGSRVVLASTCKAADPETAYGASKLIAERMVLNAGGSVARFFNVVESAGNVFEIWAGLPASEPLPVAGCSRFFIGLAEAVSLLLWSAMLGPGRFTVDPGERRRMRDVAAALYPGRETCWAPPRRGDRLVEPLHAASEWLLEAPQVDGLRQVVGAHDPELVIVESHVRSAA